MRLFALRSLVGAGVAALLAPGFATAVGFEVVVTNDFVGGNVSPDGSVVVGATASASASVYRWVDGTTTIIVSSVSGASGSAASQSGSVVVGSDNGVAFRWEGGVDQPIPFLPGGSINYASDITPDASVIVGYSYSHAGGNWQAFRYEGASLLGLDDLAGGGFESYAWAIDPAGTVIVGSGTSASGVEAARWDNLVVSGLGDFAGGTFSSTAFDVSIDGSVVVGFGTTAAGEQAFRWKNSVMEPLGDLGSGTSRALSVSGDGSLVVGRSGSQAFIWDATHGMRDLEALLTLAGVDLQGIDLNEASSISHDGETIVGTGIDTISTSSSGLAAVWIATGLTPAFLAVPVPMTSWPMTVVMVLALLLFGVGSLRLSH